MRLRMNTTVKRSELDTWRMLAGGEDMWPIVVDGDRKKVWNGVGWYDDGEATDEDRATLPTVVEG